MGRVCVSRVDVVCVCVCCTPSCYSECGVMCSLLMFVSDASGDHWWKRTRVWILLWLCMLR